MTTYQGFKNYNHWNVSLYLNNDYNLYKTALETIRRSATLDAAARELLNTLPERTPDGVRYTLSAVREAVSDLAKD